LKVSRASAKARAKQIECLVENAPSQVIDPDCPYDPNDAKAVAAFWKGGRVMLAGRPKEALHGTAARLLTK
jgi:hypothetical protein